MPSFAGVAQGLGGEGQFIEKAHERKRKEAFENLDAQLAIENALQQRKRTGIQQQGIQARLAQLQRLLAKEEEWKPVPGTVKQLDDGNWAQTYFQPSSGKSESRLIPAPSGQGAGFTTPEDAINARARAKFEAYQQLQKAGAPQELLDRFWPPAERMHWVNTQQGIVGFSNLPGHPQEPTRYTGWPPGYGSQQPPPNLELDALDQFYIGQLAENKMTEDQIDKIYSGKNEYKRRAVIAQAIARGHDPNLQLTGPAAQNVAVAQAQIDVNKPLMEEIDNLGLAQNNRPGYLAWARLKYGAGVNTPGGLADEIANLELTRVTSAASALKGSSRAWAALHLALQHTPNTWTDSPQQIRQKLATINQRLQAVIDEQRQFGTKSGLRHTIPGPSLNITGGAIELPGGKKKNLNAPANQPR